MSRLCSGCLREVGPVDLPVCPHCGAPLGPPPEPRERRLPELLGGLPVTGAETATELIERFFGQPVVYTVPGWLFGLQMVLPWGLPLALLALGERGTGVAVTVTLAVLFDLAIGWWLRPGRLAVALSRDGIAAKGRQWRWEQVSDARCGPVRKGRQEPDELVIRMRTGGQVRIGRELLRTASIGSLRNLAALLNAIVERGERA